MAAERSNPNQMANHLEFARQQDAKQNENVNGSQQSLFTKAINTNHDSDSDGDENKADISLKLLQKTAVYVSEEEASCICGEAMKLMISCSLQDCCNICGITLKKVDTKYKCNGSKHCNQWLICSACMRSTMDFNWNIIQHIHEPKRLYFIYDTKISGPCTKDEIITLYIKNKLNRNMIWIKSAEKEDSNWYELHFPDNVFKNMDKSDKTRPNQIENYLNKNKDIKQYFPEIYEHFIVNLLLGRIKKCKVEFPTNIPYKKLKSSLISLFIQTLGKILFFMMEIVLSFHCIATLLLMLIIAFCATICCYEHSAGKGRRKLILSIFTISYLGMFISPILITYFILTQTDLYNEIQSWMIGYMVWGSMSFIISAIYLVTLELKISNKTLNSVIFRIIGVGLGGFDKNFSISDFGFFAIIVVSVLKRCDYKSQTMQTLIKHIKKRDSVAGIGRFYVFPSLAAFLPAAVCGFIANYVLEQKFQLKCGDHIISDLCFDEQDEIGCCNIISSHDFEYSYNFIGGLASNILAIWALIRVIGYLIVNASSSLSIYAIRKRI